MLSWLTLTGRVTDADESPASDTHTGSGRFPDTAGRRRGRFSAVAVESRNQTGETNFSPLEADIVIIANNQQFDNTTLSDEPINRGQPFDGGELRPEVVREGYIAYEVQATLQVPDLQVEWSDSTSRGEIAAAWRTPNTES